MANIVLAFYNALFELKDREKMPHFYETIYRGLINRGHKVYLASHSNFGKDFGTIPQCEGEKISNFKPDLCIVFNNAYYCLDDYVECPIVVYEVDSPIYYSNKDVLMNNNKYMYIVNNNGSREQLKNQYGIEDNRIKKVKNFTEITAKSADYKHNISFIGTKFGVEPPYRYIDTCACLESEERKIWFLCLREVEKNPFCTKDELIRKYHISNRILEESISVPDMVMMLSAERRIKVLGAIEDLGLKIWGDRNWVDKYYFDTKLNSAFVDEPVSTIADNERIYNMSKIAINVSHLQAVYTYPWRVLDIMASNALLISDWHEEFRELLPESIVPIYKDCYEAREICVEMLADEAKRKKMVKECNEFIEDECRFRHWIKAMAKETGIKI